jgi:hypothetical protein
MKIMSYFTYIPNEMIINIVLNLDLDNIASLCLINTIFTELICNNENFWKQKYIKDFSNSKYFNDIEYNNSIQWKQIYFDTLDDIRRDLYEATIIHFDENSFDDYTNLVENFDDSYYDFMYTGVYNSYYKTYNSLSGEFGNVNTYENYEDNKWREISSIKNSDLLNYL